MLWKSDRELRKAVRLAVIVWAIVALLILANAAAAQEIHEPDVSAEMMGGGGAVWTQDDVTVVVFADTYWMPIVRDTVRDANRALPKGAPQLHLVERAPRDCAAVERERFNGPTITVCTSTTPTWWDGSTWLRAKHHVVQGERATIELIAANDRTYDRNTACHEMMHGLSWVDDNYGYPKGSKSCVIGNAPTFGKWDKQYLAARYDQHDRDQGHDGRRHGKHGGKRHR